MATGLRRWARGSGLVAVVVGLLVAGWFMHELIDAGNQGVSITVDRPVQVVQEGIVGPDAMPNVLGLDEPTARQVLVDAEIDLGRVSTDEVAYAGEPGLVVDQSPGPGEEIGESGTLTLALSTEGSMPDVTGLSEEAAREELRDLGTQVTVRPTYEPGTDEGTVIETDPAAGETLEQRVTLLAAEAESSVFVSELKSVDSDCRRGRGLIAGVEYEHSLLCPPKPSGAGRGASYLLTDGLQSFQADIGLDDAGSAVEPARFRVLVDGKVRFEAVVGFGRSRSVDVPVAGAHQVRVEAVGSVASGGDDPSQPVFGDARLVGARDAVDQIAGATGP